MVHGLNNSFNCKLPAVFNTSVCLQCFDVILGMKRPFETQNDSESACVCSSGQWDWHHTAVHAHGRTSWGLEGDFGGCYIMVDKVIDTDIRASIKLLVLADPKISCLPSAYMVLPMNANLTSVTKIRRAASAFLPFLSRHSGIWKQKRKQKQKPKINPVSGQILIPFSKQSHK